MVAVNKERGDIEISLVHDLCGTIMTRQDALKIIQAWRDYNEFWTYGLVEDECWTPKLFEEAV